ncbi:MAG TPA: DUF4430 domain-containing protein [Bacillus bacterium]|nr:DUF4430 domain-containing protein [Bacillus sp. (in: firmicutes)]
MNHIIRLLIILVVTASFLVGCAAKEVTNEQNNKIENEMQQDLQEQLPISEKSADNEDSGQYVKEETGEIAETTEKAVSKDHNEPTTSKQEANAANQPKVNHNETTSNEPKSIESNKLEEKEADQSLGQEQSAAINSATLSGTEQKIEEQKRSEKQENVVSIFIKGDEQAGVILKSTKVAFEAGDTVLELLKKVAKQNRIQMEYRGSGATAYIEGINNLYEFDKGPKSGWMYSINGVYMKKGAGLAKVEQGDKIEWIYTLDLGKDIGANVNE